MRTPGCSGRADKHLDRERFQTGHMFRETIHYSVVRAHIVSEWSVKCIQSRKRMLMRGGIPYGFQQCPQGGLVLTLVHWCHKQFITVFRYRPGSYLQWHPESSQLPHVFSENCWIVSRQPAALPSDGADGPLLSLWVQHGSLGCHSLKVTRV